MSDLSNTLYTVYKKEASVKDTSDPTPPDLKDGSYKPKYRNANGGCYALSIGADGQIGLKKEWELYEDQFMGDEIPRSFYSNYDLFVDADPFNIRQKNSFKSKYMFQTNLQIQDVDYYPVKKVATDISNINTQTVQKVKEFDRNAFIINDLLATQITSPFHTGRLDIEINENHLREGLRLKVDAQRPDIYYLETPINKCTPVTKLDKPPVYLVRKVYIVANIDPVYYQLVNLKWGWLNNNRTNPKYKLASWPEAKFLAVSNTKLNGVMGVTMDVNSFTYIVLPLFRKNLQSITASHIEYQDLAKNPFINPFSVLIHPIDILRQTRAISSLRVYIYQELIHSLRANALGLKDGVTRQYYGDQGEITENLQSNTYNFISGPSKFHGFPHDQDIYYKYIK